MSQRELVEFFSTLAVPLPQRGRENAKGECEEVLVLTDHGRPGESAVLSAEALELHSDLSYRQEPGTLSALYSVQIPESGGETMFVDCAAALASLDPEIRAELKGLKAVHRHPEPHMNPPEEATSSSQLGVI